MNISSYHNFDLTVDVTGRCNLSCSYCYRKDNTATDLSIATFATILAKALASLSKEGTLSIGFFGGEPLLRADFIRQAMALARGSCAAASVKVNFALTTNGTIAGPELWELLQSEDLALAVSFDGLPDLHDRRRKNHGGGDTSRHVLATMESLREMGRPFQTVCVIHPEDARRLPEILSYLWDHGFHDIALSLDLWAEWSSAAIARLRQAIPAAGQFWWRHQPSLRVDWFDGKLALMLDPSLATRLCRFGNGELAVAASGRLYACERLIGADEPGNSRCLPQRLEDVDNFVALRPSCGHVPRRCRSCSVAPYCNCYCRCSNYIRTGDAEKPDYLLCEWNKACFDAVAEMIEPWVKTERRCLTN